MANLIAARLTEGKAYWGQRISIPVKGATKLFAGSLVMVDATGYAVKAANGAGNHGVWGVAETTADNTSGADGAIEVIVEPGRWKFSIAGATQAVNGVIVYATDDQTVKTAQAANDCLVGRITRFEDASNVWVEIIPFSHSPGVAAG